MSATLTRPGQTDPGQDGLGYLPQKKRPGRLRRVLTVILVSLLVAGLVVGAGWLLFFSTVFAVDAVVIRGTQRTADGTVAKAAAVPLGVPLARQNLRAIAKRATAVPAVEAATATREWPRTVVVTVTERQPVLAVRQPTGYAIVDRGGVAYELSATLPKGLMIAEVNPGDVALLRDVGVVSRALPGKLAGRVARIRATSHDNITLVLTSGVIVTWGNVAESDLKADVTLALLKRKPKVSIDVSGPHQPAVR